MSFEDLHLRIYGDQVLRKRAEEITEFGPELEEMAHRMFEVMYEEEGLGLAANQVGVTQRMAVLDVPTEDGGNFTGVIINPEIVETQGTQKDQEGCLSIPGLREEVIRHQWMKVRAQDLQGDTFEFECSDILSRAVQHEIDHLDGILFVDRLSPIRRRLLTKKLKKLAADREESRVS